MVRQMLRESKAYRNRNRSTYKITDRLVDGCMVQPYRTQTAMFDGREYRWEGTTAAWANASRNSSDGSRFVEFVTSPNNPDALLRAPVLRGSAVIADHAYYWPHFTHIAAPADEDVMLFTMSKPSGHAGSRLGCVSYYSVLCARAYL